MKKAALAVVFFGVALGCGVCQAQDVVVIANKSLKNADISAADLKEVFSGDKSSLKGDGHVVPITLKGGPAHEAFLKKYIGKNDVAFRAGWRTLVFAGTASMPKTMDTDSAMVEYVAATPGAIGYVGKDPGDTVKKLAVK